MLKKKEDYRRDVHNLPETAAPGESPHGSRAGHRERYAGIQKRLGDQLDQFDRLDCKNKKNRPKGFNERNLGRARNLAKEYEPLKKIEQEVDGGGWSWPNWSWPDVPDVWYDGDPFDPWKLIPIFGPQEGPWPAPGY
jgi:hypothetical protein